MPYYGLIEVCLDPRLVRKSRLNLCSDQEHDSDQDSSHSLPVCVPMSLSSRIAFGPTGDIVRPSNSFDSLAALYDGHWVPKFRPGTAGNKPKVSGIG